MGMCAASRASRQSRRRMREAARNLLCGGLSDRRRRRDSVLEQFP
jgi:hypothetical protein